MTQCLAQESLRVLVARVLRVRSQKARTRWHRLLVHPLLLQLRRPQLCPRLRLWLWLWLQVGSKGGARIGYTTNIFDKTLSTGFGQHASVVGSPTTMNRSSRSVHYRTLAGLDPLDITWLLTENSQHPQE